MRAAGSNNVKDFCKRGHRQPPLEERKASGCVECSRLRAAAQRARLRAERGLA
jgi:hypothetical protein